MTEINLADKNLWLSRKQLKEIYTAIPPGGWDHLLFYRDSNGLEKCVVSIGRRVVIHRPSLEQWLNSKLNNKEGKSC